MSNEIVYGLKFTEDLLKALNTAKAIDKQVGDTIVKKRKSKELEFQELDAEIKMREHLAQIEIELVKEEYLAEKVMQEKLAKFEIDDDKMIAEMQRVEDLRTHEKRIAFEKEEYLAEKVMQEKIALLEIKDDKMIAEMQRVEDLRTHEKRIAFEKEEYLAEKVMQEKLAKFEIDDDKMIAANNEKLQDQTFAHRMKLLNEQKAREKTLRDIDARESMSIQKKITAEQNKVMKSQVQQPSGGKGSMFTPAKTVKRVAGYVGTTTLLYGGMGALKEARDAVIDYDQALNNIYMAMRNVTDADKAMIRSITTNSDLTAKYGKDYVELAKSLEVLVKAGLKLGEANIMLEPSLKLAAAGEMELDEASRALTQSLRNIGKPIGYANEMADALASGAAASAVDIKDLIVSLEGVGAAGTTFGMQAKELVAWIGAVGNVGLKGKEAANAVSRMWLRITKPQKEVQDILKKGKIEIFEGVGEEQRLRKFEDIMTDLANSTLSLSEKQKLLGVHAFKSGEQIQSAVLSYQNLSHEMANVNDEAERMAKQKMEGLQGKIDRLKATWNDIFITQGGISTSLGFAVDKITTLLSWIDANPEMAKLMFIAAAGAVGAAGGAMVGGIPLAITGAVGAAGLTTYGLFGMDTSENISREKREATQNAFQKKAEEFAEWQTRHERKLADVKIFTFKKLEQELLAANKILKERNSEEDVFIKKLKEKYDAYDKIKKLEITGTELAKLANKQEYKDKGWGTSQVKNELLKQAKLDIFNAETALEGFRVGKQYINQRVLSAQKEITTRKQGGVTTDDGGNKTPKNQKELKDRYKSPILQFRKLEQESAMQTLPKYLADIAKVELDAFEKKEKQKQELMETYDTFTQLQKLSQQEQELLLLADSEEAKYSIRVEYAEKTGELLSTQYEKEHQITSAFWQSVQAGQQSFTNSLIDMDMTGKERRETIWTSFRDFFLKAIIDMAIKYMIFAAITNLIPGGFAGGFGGMIGKIFGVGAGSFSGGIKLNDAVVADGKVYPYRKDDLVMIGTNLDNRSGATLPTQSMVNGAGSRNDNSALISELKSLRLAVARSDANNVKAIVENKPERPVLKIGDKEIYESSEKGKRKSNFIVSPT